MHLNGTPSIPNYKFIQIKHKYFLDKNLFAICYVFRYILCLDA